MFTQGIFSPNVPADNDRHGHIFDLKDCRLGYNFKWQVLVSVGYLSDVTSGRLCLKSLCHSTSPRQNIYVYLYCCCFISHTLVYGDLFSLSYDVSPVCVSKNLNHFHKGLGGKNILTRWNTNHSGQPNPLDYFFEIWIINSVSSLLFFVAQWFNLLFRFVKLYACVYIYTCGLVFSFFVLCRYACVMSAVKWRCITL